MASMAAMEQATLGQYFTTRRKGLEGVHPAKRRKVDVTEVVSDVTVRRSQRSKRQEAARTKISRSRGGVKSKSNAKGSLNEESAQSSCKGSKFVSETTSLFDDHAFAEAFIEKLTDAQRKRKMASSTQMEEAVPRDKSDVEITQVQASKDDMESKPKSRRRTARSSKSAKQAEKSENSKILEATEKVTLLVDQTPREADIPVEKETIASPSKTPPVVRRIGGGVKPNPWIAEQAKIVLSRGREAVNLSQKSRKKEDKQITSSKASASVKNSKADRVGANVNKAQEDLAKARKLIKNMRSLEKNASKPSQSSTVDDGPRLHQVASSKRSLDNEGSQSLKVPAYERFHALAQPSPSDTSTATLPLPYKYKTLAEMFRCTDTVLNLLGQRKEKCTYPKLRDAVQQMSRKRFEKKHLAQMKTVYPSALEFHQDKCPGKSSSFELTVEFGKTEDSLSKLTLTASEMLARKGTFLTNLLKITKRHHQDFLCNLNPALSVDDNKIMRWHPKFRLDDVPDVDEADLPQPPVVKTYSSAHDVLEKARDMIAPRVEKALRTVALKEQEDKEQRATTKNSKNNLVEKNVMTNKLIENTENKNSLKHKSALKGISQDLLNKIRQKEAKKIEENMLRDPLVDKKLAMKERLPDLCRILKAYFSAERKAAIPLDDATIKLSESYKTSLSSVQVEEHIRFMSQLVPEWISVLTVRKCVYIKINKTADVNNVINKLMTKEFH